MTDTARVHPTASRHHRFHFLDALRGVVSTLVVFLHVPASISFRPVHNAQLAVDFFFCLSGFVIAFSYEKRLQGTLDLKRFVAARVIRLYPMYALGIGLGALILVTFDWTLPLTPTVFLRLAALFVLQTLMLPPLHLWFSFSLFPLDYPAWSIFFEMLANIAYAWMVRRRVAGTWQLGILLCTSLAALSYWLLRGGTIDVGHQRTWTTSLAIFRVAFSFVAGVFVWRLFHRRATQPWTALRSGVVALGVAATMIVMLIGPIAAMQGRLFSLIAVTVLFPCLVYLGASCRLSGRWVGPSDFLGNLSYPLYLLHVSFMEVLTLPWFVRIAREHAALQPEMVVGVLAVSATAAALATRFYDVPVRGFLTRRYNLLQQRRALSAED